MVGYNNNRINLCIPLPPKIPFCLSTHRCFYHILLWSFRRSYRWLSDSLRIYFWSNWQISFHFCLGPSLWTHIPGMIQFTSGKITNNRLKINCSLFCRFYLYRWITSLSSTLKDLCFTVASQEPPAVRQLWGSHLSWYRFARKVYPGGGFPFRAAGLRCRWGWGFWTW